MKLKETTIKWFPVIPESWDIVPLKWHTSTVTGITFTKSDLVEEGNAVLSYGQIHAKVNPATTLEEHLLRYVPDSFVENKNGAKVNQGDFIFADTSEDIEGCGNFVYIDKPIELYAGYHTTILRNKGLLNGRYYAYLFKSDEWRSQIRSKVKAVKLYSVTQSIINQSFILVPPLEIQQRIADYLDWECSKIDKKVGLLEKKSAAYHRLRQSLINQTVTKGLNSDVPMKPSGIEWLGDIPAHWVIKRGKSIFNQLNRETTEEDGVVTCYRDGEVTLRSKRRLTGYTESEKEIGYHGVRKGDLVIHQMDAFAGSIGISDSNGKCSPICITCVPFDDEITNMQYYCHLLRVMAKSGYIQALAKGIRERTTDFRFKTLVVLIFPVPTIKEQREIVEYLNEKCGKIDAIVENIAKQIQHLKYLKRALINETVTGKRKISNARVQNSSRNE